MTRSTVTNVDGEWTIPGQPGRGESCHRCGADLRVCLNCASYDPRAAQQCRDRRAEPVLEKAAGDFLPEYFEMARRVFTPPGRRGPCARIPPANA